MDNRNSCFIFTFEWHSLLKDLLKNFWLIILAGIVAAMGIYVSERSIYSPNYTSRATLVVRAKTGTAGTYTNLTVSADMANIFTTVFTDSSVKKMAAANLGMEKFQGTVSASAISGINIMSLAVTADDPELAFNLLCSMLEIYPNISESIFADAVLDILVAPQMPTAPSNSLSLAHRSLIILGIMAVMAMMIIVLSLLRDTVKHVKGFETFIDSKILSTITHEPRHLTLREFLLHKKRALLINDPFATLKFTEDYRKTAAKLEYMQKYQGCKSFAVTSVAENEGKSTVAANLALVLASRGFRVMLLDMDFRKPSIHKIFSTTTEIQTDFSDVLSRKTAPKDYRFLRYKKTELLLAMNTHHCSDTSAWLGSEFIAQYIGKLADKMDFILIDTPPVAASADAAHVINICDKTLLVVRTDTVAASDINDTILNIATFGGNLAGCILNDVYPPFTMFGQMGADSNGLYNNRYTPYDRYKNFGNSLTEYNFVADDDHINKSETDRSNS